MFLCNKKDPKLLKVILVTKNLTLDSSQPLPFSRVLSVVKAERRPVRIQVRGTSVCTRLSHEQLRAVGGLRQTRSHSDDPCLENANESRTEAV